MVLLSKFYSNSEELANAFSHFLGSILAIVGTYFMLSFSLKFGSSVHIFVSLTFGLSLFFLFTFSALTHITAHPKAKLIFSNLDQISIFILIAGTYTPFALIALKGITGWIIFILEWSLALIGIFLKIFDKEKLEDKAKKRFIILYLLMGWLFLINPIALYKAIKIKGLLLVLLAGLFYSTGIFFYNWQKLKYHHLIWHIFVLIASALFYFCIYFYVLPIKI